MCLPNRWQKKKRRKKVEVPVSCRKKRGKEIIGWLAVVQKKKRKGEREFKSLSSSTDLRNAWQGNRLLTNCVCSGGASVSSPSFFAWTIKVLIVSTLAWKTHTHTLPAFSVCLSVCVLLVSLVVVWRLPHRRKVKMIASHCHSSSDNGFETRKKRFRGWVSQPASKSGRKECSQLGGDGHHHH